MQLKYKLKKAMAVILCLSIFVSFAVTVAAGVHLVCCKREHCAICTAVHSTVYSLNHVSGGRTSQHVFGTVKLLFTAALFVILTNIFIILPSLISHKIRIDI